MHTSSLNRVNVISSRLADPLMVCTECSSPTRDGRCWICGNGLAGTGEPQSPLVLLFNLIRGILIGPYGALQVHEIKCLDDKKPGGCQHSRIFIVLKFMVSSGIIGVATLQSQTPTYHFSHPLVVAILAACFFHPVLLFVLGLQFFIGLGVWTKYRALQLTHSTRR